MKKKYFILFIGLIFGIISCNNSKEIQINSSDSSSKDMEDNTIKKDIDINKNSGIPGKTVIDFYAHAADGEWNLSIRFGGDINFNSVANHIQFFAPTNKTIVANGANVVSLFAENEKYILKATIDIVNCTKEGRKVTSVMIREKDKKKGIDFSGCGYYMGNPDLQNVWIVEEINGKKLTANEFPQELPHFQFNLLNKKISGFAGCNQVHGNIEFAYRQMNITQLVSTRMYCGEASKIESQIISILNGNPFYHFDKELLIIETTEGSMKLKRVNR